MISGKRLNAQFGGAALCAAIACLFAGCCTQPRHVPASSRNRFIGFTNFAAFEYFANSNGDTVLRSPIISPGIPWNELVVSWNAQPGAGLKVEASAALSGHSTKNYVLGEWSDDPSKFPRQSFAKQADADGDVLTDTLVLKEVAREVQLRVTLIGTNVSALKFVGLSFLNSQVSPDPRRPNTAAWGKLLAVPERVQSGYEGPGGWCSPASVSMVLGFWAQKMNRPELDRSVPEVATAVNDPVYGGTGNWPFNTAFAGELPGMRAFVRRFDDLADLEDCLAAGIPVVMSVSSYLTEDRHDGPDNGHLIVCVGFAENGDVICNDPGVSLRRGETVRRVYPRERVEAAWRKSKNTVYLIYPESLSRVDETFRGFRAGAGR